MLYYCINGKPYGLDLDDYYENKVSNYRCGDFLEFDNLNLEERYQKIDELFGMVVRYFVGAFGGRADDYLDDKYSEDIKEIIRKSRSG